MYFQSLTFPLTGMISCELHKGMCTELAWVKFASDPNPTPILKLYVRLELLGFWYPIFQNGRIFMVSFYLTQFFIHLTIKAAICEFLPYTRDIGV